MSRPVWRDLHGIILLDKPEGLSSNQALQRVRRLLGAAKGGHTGALDPLATGLLPLCFGEATKLAGRLLGSRKAYRASCQLGVSTATADREGEVVARQAVPPLTEAALQAALAPLRGRIRQRPPAYSALKRGGEPLYLKARRGETVEVPPREVEVHRLELTQRAGDRLELYVECGSGTYIRSLAADLGAALGCGAHVLALRRLWLEPFLAPAMVTLDELEQLAAVGADTLLTKLLPTAAGLLGLPRLELTAAESFAVQRGQCLSLPGRGIEGDCAVFDPSGRPLALATLDGAGLLRINRGLNLPIQPAGP